MQQEEITQEDKVKTIDTNIKFERSERTGNPIIGFVSKVDGVWRGVRRNAPTPKLIVVVDRKIAPFVKEGMVYNCHLVPMISKKGFVAVQVALMQYEAAIESRISGGSFTVSVKFGNEAITYDRKSDDPLVNDIGIVTERIRGCQQIRNVESVINDFTDHVYDMQNLFLKVCGDGVE